MPPTTSTMSLLSPLRPSSSSLSKSANQIRHASLLRRPKRPYTFTQMITLSDGSTYLHRTTSPMPIYRSTKDTKNNPLWNPSSQKLANVEEDEAGRLKRFRGRFGRGWDAEVVTGAEEVSLRYRYLCAWDVLIGDNCADWWTCRREMAKKDSSLRMARTVCWISFLAMDRPQRRRARLLALLRRSKRAERARAARSECDANTQRDYERRLESRRKKRMASLNGDTAMVWQAHESGRGLGCSGIYKWANHQLWDCTVKVVGWWICKRCKAQKKGSQCTIPISVIQQSDLLLRYSTFTKFPKEDASCDLGDTFQSVPERHASFQTYPAPDPLSKMMLRANTRHRRRRGSCW